jgi:hypothetical protein
MCRHCSAGGPAFGLLFDVHVAADANAYRPGSAVFISAERTRSGLTSAAIESDPNPCLEIDPIQDFQRPFGRSGFLLPADSVVISRVAKRDRSIRPQLRFRPCVPARGLLQDRDHAAARVVLNWALSELAREPGQQGEVAVAASANCETATLA